MSSSNTSRYSQNVADNGKSYAHLLSGLRVGGQRGICTACGEAFTSNSGYDRHQSVKKFTNEFGVADVQVVCKHPSKIGLVQDETGYWQVPKPGQSVTAQMPLVSEGVELGGSKT